MKISIRKRVLILFLAFSAVILLVLGLGTFFVMERSAKFASHYAEEISNQAIDNSSNTIISMRQHELMFIVEKTASDIAGFTGEVRRDVHLLKLEMERIWSDPSGYKRTVAPLAREDQLFYESIDINAIDQTVFSFVTYAPGVDPASVKEELEVTSNIQDFLIAFAEQAQMRNGHKTGVVGTKSGFLIKGDIVASPPNIEFRESSWYRTTMEKGELSFTPIYLIQGTKSRVAVACTEPYRRGDEIMGVIGFGLVLDELEKLMQESLVFINEVNPNGLNFMLDEQGRVIFCQHLENGDDEVLNDIFNKIKNFEQFPTFNYHAFVSAVENMKNGKKDMLNFEYGGNTYILAYAPVEGMNWSVGAIIPVPNLGIEAENNRRQIQSVTENIIQELRFDMRDGNLFIFFLTLLLASLCIYGGRKLSDRLVKPLLELRDGLKDIATGNLDKKIALKTGDEIEEVADAVNAMTVDLKTYIRHISGLMAEKERMSVELNVAKSIQKGDLPHDFDLPYKEFELYASMDTAKEVGGDFYDFYMLDDTHLAVTIADVSGKGIPAALFMMRSRTILKNIAVMSYTLKNYADVVSLANKQICDDNEELMFVTAFFGVLDLENGDFCYVNCGHNPPLICHEGKAQYIHMPERTTVLGIFDEETYHEYHLTLEPGDMIFFYTDGVTEAMNEQNEMYSEGRLEETLDGCALKSVKEILATVLEDVKTYAGNAEQSDDITMLGVRFIGKST